MSNERKFLAVLFLITVGGFIFGLLATILTLWSSGLPTVIPREVILLLLFLGGVVLLSAVMYIIIGILENPRY